MHSILRISRTRRRGAFTLVEMLVVITIIGILAALAIPAVYYGIVAARETAIKLEVKDLQRAIESYKDKHNDYPPDFTETVAVGQPNDQPWNNSIAGRHLRKIARRSFVNGNAAGSQNLAQMRWTHVHASFTSPAVTATNFMYAELDAAEALVFFLSGLSNDVQRPFTGPGGPMDRDPTNFPQPNPNSQFVPFMTFDTSRLRDIDQDGFFEYYPKFDINLPYVYFDSRAYALANTNFTPPRPSAVYPPLSRRDMTNEVRPYARDATTAGQFQFAAAGAFQIISTGLDGYYGIFPQNVTPANAKSWPSGFNYDTADRDNITSFNETRTLGDDLP